MFFEYIRNQIYQEPLLFIYFIGSLIGLGIVLLALPTLIDRARKRKE